MMKFVFSALLALVILTRFEALAQGVAINNDNAAPDPSAMLDVKSTDKGMLVPRMTTSQRTSISSPAAGLLVYDNTTASFWLYNGTLWDELISSTNNANQLADSDGDTKLMLEKNPDEDILRLNIAGSERLRIDGTRITPVNSYSNIFLGQNTGNNSSQRSSIAIGNRALAINQFGTGSIAIGDSALSNNMGENFQFRGQCNTAIGHRSMDENTIGYFNTALGYGTLVNNVSGSLNTAIGFNSLASNNSSANTGIGFSALLVNETGESNTAVGTYAMLSNFSGNYNSAMGYSSNNENITGHFNSSFGAFSLYSNVTGSGNVAAGDSALYHCTTNEITAVGTKAGFENANGYANVYVGAFSGYNSDGNNNSFFGRRSGYVNTTGSGNTYLGCYADGTSSGWNNATALGYNTKATASNQVRIGNNSVTSIGGNAGWTNFSDGRFKKNIRQDIPGLDFILKLNPVSYELDIAGLDQSMNITNENPHYESPTRQTGFIAQEVEQTAQSVGYEFSGVDKPKNEDDYYGLRYAEFVVPLVRAVQEQQAMIEKLQLKIEELEKQLKD